MMYYVHFRSPKPSDVVTLSLENDSTENKQIRIMTLCQGCNTLVPDIHQHLDFGQCKSEPNQASDNSQNGISNRVFLSLDDLNKINSSPKVLDDLGNHQLNQSGVCHTIREMSLFIIDLNILNHVNNFIYILLEIKRSSRKRKLEKEDVKIEKWCDICEHSFSSQLKFANHLRRKDEFGRLCRPPPGKSNSFLSGIINYTQESPKSKKSRRIGIIRKGTKSSM